MVLCFQMSVAVVKIHKDEDSMCVYLNSRNHSIYKEDMENIN